METEAQREEGLCRGRTAGASVARTCCYPDRISLILVLSPQYPSLRQLPSSMTRPKPDLSFQGSGKAKSLPQTQSCPDWAPRLTEPGCRQVSGAHWSSQVCGGVPAPLPMAPQSPDQTRVQGCCCLCENSLQGALKEEGAGVRATEKKPGKDGAVERTEAATERTREPKRERGTNSNKTEGNQPDQKDRGKERCLLGQTETERGRQRQR